MLKVLRLALIIPCLLTTVLSFADGPDKVSTPVNGPLAFEANRGQTAPVVKYLARTREGILFFTDSGLTVSVPQTGSFRLQFEGATVPSTINAEGKLQARSNYLSADPSQSITQVENYSALRYRSVFPGVDVAFYGQGQHLEHDFLVASGVDASQIALRVEGIDRITMLPGGEVELALGKAKLYESAPVAWQNIGGKRVTVQARWRMIDAKRLGFALGAYDHTQPLVIDPVLTYSTHFGGSTGQDISQGTTFPADTFIEAVSLDPSRNIYISGTTSAADFPTTAGAFQRTPNQFGTFHADTNTLSGFVSKFDPTGRILIYSTFLRNDIPMIAVDSAGHVYAAKGQDDHFAGPSDGFDAGVAVDKLSIDGSHLLYSFRFAQTPVGAPVSCQDAFGGSQPGGIAVDNLGHVWIGGSTDNNCMPTTAGAFQRTMAASDVSGFVVKLDTTKSGAASIVYSTFLGGSKTDDINALAVDSSGDAYLLGTTQSTDFPHGAVFGTVTPTDNGQTGFVAKLNAAGSALVFSTEVHGVNGFQAREGLFADSTATNGIAVDAAHNIYIAGTTTSSGYPTTAGAFDRTFAGGTCTDRFNNTSICSDGYITKLNAAGNALIFSTFLGGSANDAINGLAINNAGMPFVTGFTSSSNFPTTASAFKKTYPAGATQTGFVTALNANGQSLYYSTLLGGSHDTSAFAVFVDSAWNAYVVGNTLDADYPVTSNAFQPSFKGRSDGFLAKIVIAADLHALMHSNVTSVARNGVVTFFAQVSNLGPDGSDSVVLTDPIPPGFTFSGVFTNTATSCSTPAVGAASGTVSCRKTRLEKGQSFYVNIYLKAVAASGSTLTNKVSVTARTQDLKRSNNSAAVSVKVQ